MLLDNQVEDCYGCLPQIYNSKRFEANDRHGGQKDKSTTTYIIHESFCQLTQALKY